MLKRLREDSGMAMVTAVMASLVVVTISAAGFALATHNLDASAGNRRVVQSVHGAEAGLDAFLEYLANTGSITAPVCTMTSTTPLGTTPSTTYSVEATYYSSADGTGTPVRSASNCTGSAIPQSAVLTSQGATGGRTRTMQTLVQLAPNLTSAISGYAVHAKGTASWGSQATITNAAGTELPADLYSDTAIELKGTGIIYGNVYSQGSVLMSGQAEVKRSVIAKTSVTVGQNAMIREDGRAATGSLTNNGTINRNAYYCTGSAPSGTVVGAKVQECKPVDTPPAETFPVRSYVPGSWQTDGYDTSNTFTSCSTAEAFLSSLGSQPAANYVVRVNSTCLLTIPAVTLSGSLAIIADGDIRGTGSTTVTRSGSSPQFTLQLWSNLANTPLTTGGPACGANSGISLAAGTTFPDGVDVLFYTACDVTFTGNATANIQGQIIAGRDVRFTSSGANITYKPILVPGAPNPIGFRESVRYRSEIID
jgi:hypothetical protein